MNSKQTNLISVIEELVDTYWEKNKEPLLLSNLSPLITQNINDENYKNELEGKSLKQFISSRGEKTGWKIVQHPIQLAKIGLIPSESGFQFSADENILKSRIDVKPKNSRSSDAVALLDILKKLPASELEKINLPISVLVKLHK